MPNPRRLVSPTMTLVALAWVAPFAASASAATLDDELSDLKDALCFGKPSATIRYRYERVDQATFTHEADASTLRVALGYETKPYHGLSIFGQYEGVYLVGDDLYKSPINTKVQYPVVNDPETSELNQAYLKYTCPADTWKTTFKVGRQEFLLGNQRLVGNVGWRQDNQSFDGASATTAPLHGPDQNLALGYAYFTAVHRIFSEASIVNPREGRLEMHTQVGSLAYKLPDRGMVSLYGVFLDYDDRLPAIENQSSETLGARIEGPWKADADFSVLYAGEFARQTAFGTNPNSYTADYWMAELGAACKFVALKVGYQVLQGDGATDKFTTPLATGHSFNGWADLFLVTPNNGLAAASVALDVVVPGINGLTFTAIGYNFSAQTGSDHYGRELDLRLEYRVIPFDKNLLIGVKFADFIGDNMSNAGGAANQDVNKFWVYTQYTF